jgi:four helix bundle protein
LEGKDKKSRSYQDLEVWKSSIALVKEVYQVTARFPSSEIYGLTNQIRRASVSIPSNIAEGQGRISPKEFRQFLSISIGSLAEVETQLIIAKEINYLAQEELNPLLIKIDHIRKMTKALLNSIK